MSGKKDLSRMMSIDNEDEKEELEKVLPVLFPCSIREKKRGAMAMAEDSESESESESRRKRERKKMSSDDDDDDDDEERERERERRRMLRVKRIVKMMKAVESSWRKTKTIIPSLEEQRIIILIANHVSDCIFHYYRESLDSLVNPASASAPQSLLDLTARLVDQSHYTLQQVSDIRQIEVGFDGSDACIIRGCRLRDKFDTIIGILKTCRKSIITTPTGTDAYIPLCPQYRLQEADDDNYDYSKTRRQLLHILSQLEDMAQLRHYAPPRTQEEIQCYLKIREHITSCIIFPTALCKFRRGLYPLYNSVMHSEGPLSFYHDTYLSAYNRPGNYIATTLEFMPCLTRFIKHRCNNVLPNIFSSSYEQVADDDDDDEQVADDNDGGAAKMGLVVPKSRVECLKIVASKFDDFISLLPEKDTLSTKEMRLYVHIAQHIASYAALFRKATPKEKRTGTGSHQVNVANIKDPFCNQSTTEGNNITIREQCLLEIVSYLNAMKSSCAAGVPSEEELAYYVKLLHTFKKKFRLFSPFSKCIVEEKDEVKKKLKAWSTRYLHSFFIDEECLLGELEDECRRFINMLGSVVVPDGKIEEGSLEEAFNWFSSNRNDIVNGLNRFFSEQQLGGVKKLDETILALTEVRCCSLSICLMCSDTRMAVSSDVLDYEFELMEATNALHVMNMTAKK